MKIYLKFLFVAFSLLLVFPSVGSAQESPFGWRANVKMLSATEGEVIVKVTIANGWHLYGMNLPKGGPKSTSFDFSKSTGIKLIGKVLQSATPVSKFDSMFNLKLTYWTGSVTFRQKFKVTKPSVAKIEGVVNYMGCNDYTCSPPSTFKISKPIPVKK